MIQVSQPALKGARLFLLLLILLDLLYLKFAFNFPSIDGMLIDDL